MEIERLRRKARMQRLFVIVCKKRQGKIILLKKKKTSKIAIEFIQNSCINIVLGGKLADNALFPLIQAAKNYCTFIALFTVMYILLFQFILFPNSLFLISIYTTITMIVDKRHTTIPSTSYVFLFIF